MSAFGGLILTNRGRNLQAKAQAGVTLKYTRIALGDGPLGTSAIPDLTALKKEVISLPIAKLRVMTGSRAIIGAVLTNKDLTTGFYYRELGIFAQDPDLGEILYCYGNSGSLAEYIPAGGGADVLEKSIDLEILIGNAANVSAVIDSSLVYITMPELEATKAELKKYADDAVGAIDLSGYVTKTVFNEHLADEVKHINAAERTKWNAAEQNAKDASIPRSGGVSVTDSIYFNRTSPDGEFWFNYYAKQWQIGGEPILHSGNASTLLTSLGVPKKATGSFVGNATSPRPISVGFTPNIVFLLSNMILVIIHKNGSVYLQMNSSNYYQGDMKIVDNGFQTNSNFNGNGQTYEWFAFG